MKPALRTYVQSAVLLVLPGLFVTVLGYVLAGRGGMAACAFGYTIVVISASFFAFPTVLKQHRAEYIPRHHAPGLYELSGELARRAGIQPPALYLMSEKAPHLFIAGRSVDRAAIVFSKDLLEVLNSDEFASVMAHGIGLISSGAAIPMTIAARMAGWLVAVSNFFRWSHFLPLRGRHVASRNGIESDSFLWIVIAPIAAGLIRLAAYPSRYFLADEASVRLVGNDDPLRAALWKLEVAKRSIPLGSVSPATAHLFFCNPLSEEGSIRMFQSQPPLQVRLQRLEALHRGPIESTAWVGSPRK